MAVAQSQKRQEADIGSLQPTGCPKKPPSTASWLLLKLAVEGNIPSNPVSQNSNSESAFFLGQAVDNIPIYIFCGQIIPLSWI